MAGLLAGIRDDFDCIFGQLNWARPFDCISFDLLVWEPVERHKSIFEFVHDSPSFRSAFVSNSIQFPTMLEPCNAASRGKIYEGRQE